MFTDKIYPALNSGCRVVVKKGNEFQVISPDKDGSGDFRRSGWWNTLEEAAEFVGNLTGYSKDNINKLAKEEHWEIVGEPYRPEYEHFKVGDPVRILDSIKECSDWKGVKDDYPNMKGEIIKIYNHINGLYYIVKGKNIGFGIGAEYLIPDTEEEVMEMKAEDAISELEKIHGRKIKLVK